MQSDLDFLNSLSLSDPPPSQPPTILSPFSDLPVTSTGEIDLSSLDEADVEDLLRRMEDAESAADGLESRLDNLLGTLDGLLGVLEDKEDDAGAIDPEEELGAAKENGEDSGEPKGEAKE